MKLLIVVTHLLGTGHLARALTLGRSFAKSGHKVTVASGGQPAPQLDAQGVDLVQIPELRSNGVDFSQLLTSDGVLADEDYMASRRQKLCTIFEQNAPDVLITELYPFGRRSLRTEFQTLLDTAKSHPKPPVIFSSIRDILAPPSKPKKAHDAETMIDSYYDGILVHSDPVTTPLEASWPVSDALRKKLHYTGYVTAPAPAPHPDGAGKGEILVSAGGGDVGRALYVCAIEAAKIMPDYRWRLLVGGGATAHARIADLSDPTSPAILEPARSDFRQMLPLAAASVSMCGYNTALDLLQTGTPAVFVPFDAGNEVEQGLRAQSLAPLSGIDIIRSSELNPQNLCDALRSVIAAPPRDRTTLNFSGTTRSVEIVTNFLEQFR